MRHRHALLLALSALLALGTCGLFGGEEAVGAAVAAETRAKPGFADPDAAVAILSAYRRGRGLSAVTISPTLTAIAARHARRMAETNRLDHVLPGEGSFMRRMTAGGYDAAVAAENIGGGYKTLPEAMNGWKKSRAHDKNLLRSGITEIGIAVAYSPDGKFRYWWSLVLAGPWEPPVGGPAGGPFSMDQ